MARRKLSKRDARVVNALRKATRGRRPRVRHVEFTRTDTAITVVRIADVSGRPLYAHRGDLASVRGLHLKRIIRTLEGLPRRSRATRLSGRCADGDVLLVRIR